MLFDISLSNMFLISPQAKATETAVNKWYYIKLKKLLCSEGNQQQNEKATY